MLFAAGCCSVCLRAGMERGLHLHPMRLQRTCLPYLVIVAVVMSIYSIFLVHLTKSFRPSSWDQVNIPQKLENCFDRVVCCVHTICTNCCTSCHKQFTGVLACTGYTLTAQWSVGIRATSLYRLFVARESSQPSLSGGRLPTRSRGKSTHRQEKEMFFFCERV